MVGGPAHVKMPANAGLCGAVERDRRDENGHVGQPNNRSAAALHLVPRGRPQASIVLSA